MCRGKRCSVDRARATSDQQAALKGQWDAALPGSALTADGRLDGYCEAYINAWDVAAGLMLVAEAGGQSSDFFVQAEAMTAENVILVAAPAFEERLQELLLG